MYMKKGLRFVFRSPPNRGFHSDRKVYSLIVSPFIVFHGTVCNTFNVVLQNGFIMTSFLIVSRKGRGNEE